MGQKISKTELIKLLHSERNQLKDLLNRINEKRMEIPNVQGNWSVKDIIAHITVWEHRGTKWIEAIVKGEEPKIPLAGYIVSDMDNMVKIINKLNEETYQKNKNRPLKDILEEFDEAFLKLIEQVQALSEDQLNKSFQADWTPNNRISTFDIVEWHLDHSRSHMKYIMNWLEKLESERINR